MVESMFLSKPEKWFLVIFTTLTFISLISTAMAFIIDKHAITGTILNPSICMMSHSFDCQTVYTSKTIRDFVQITAGVDLTLSCVSFTIGVVITSVQILNSRILFAFLLITIFKNIFINSSILLIVTNTDYYINTVHNIIMGTCGHHLCWEDENANVAAAFILLLASGTITFFTMLTFLILGVKIVKKYDDLHKDEIWAKWDDIAAQLVSY